MAQENNSFQGTLILSFDIESMQVAMENCLEARRRDGASRPTRRSYMCLLILRVNIYLHKKIANMQILDLSLLVEPPLS